MSAPIVIFFSENFILYDLHARFFFFFLNQFHDFQLSLFGNFSSHSLPFHLDLFSLISFRSTSQGVLLNPVHQIGQEVFNIFPLVLVVNKVVNN